MFLLVIFTFPTFVNQDIRLFFFHFLKTNLRNCPNYQHSEEHAIIFNSSKNTKDTKSYHFKNERKHEKSGQSENSI